MIQEDLMKDPLPVQEYLKFQGRFSHIKHQDMETVQKRVDHQWDRLLKKAKC